MQSCVRKLHFCYGHRVMNHESKCRNLHGHNGVLWIHATVVNNLDDLGRVIDFGVLKQKIGSWVDENWDHTMIINKDDLKTIDLLNEVDRNKEIFILPYNPTAENMANYLLHEVCPEQLFKMGVIVHQVDLHETENCVAKASLDPKDDKIRKLYGY